MAVGPESFESGLWSSKRFSAVSKQWQLSSAHFGRRAHLIASRLGRKAVLATRFQCFCKRKTNEKPE